MGHGFSPRLFLFGLLFLHLFPPLEKAGSKEAYHQSVSRLLLQVSSLLPETGGGFKRRQTGKREERREAMEKGGERLVGRSHFSLTCRLLSQYLKKNGSFGDLGLLLAPRPIDHQAKGNFWVPNTICFKPGNEISGMDHHHADKSRDKNASNSLELMVSQHSISLNSSAIPRTEESTKPSDAKEIGKDQLTIFYGGQILVFDNFPADKAKDLLLMASKESIADPADDCTSNEPSVALQSRLPKPGQANSSDMPIARRNSLNRFLGKRKDRMGQAPYQVDGGSAGPAAAKPAENQPWLSLGPKPESSSQSSR